MARVLDFLDFEYDKEDLEKRLQEDYSTFKRYSYIGSRETLREGVL